MPYSHHAYAYALGNPILFTDPSGRCVPFLQADCSFSDAASDAGDFFKGAHGISPDAGWMESWWEFGWQAQSQINPALAAYNTAETGRHLSEQGGAYLARSWREDKNIGDYANDAGSFVWNNVKKPWEDFGTGWNCGDAYLLGRGTVGIANEAFAIASIGAGARAFAQRGLAALRPSTLPTSKLRFSQSTVSNMFAEGPWEGMTIDEVAQGVRNGNITLDRGLDVFTKRWWMNYIPSTKYVTRSGKVYTGSFTNLDNGVTYVLNNRALTLTISSEAEMVNVNWQNIYQVWNKSYQFDTPNKGIYVLIRETGKQVRVR